MQLAVSGIKVSATLPQRDTRRGTSAGASHTKAEQYWATRALVAETLLSARDRHQADLAAMRRMEAKKREASHMDVYSAWLIPTKGRDSSYIGRQRSEAEDNGEPFLISLGSRTVELRW